MPHWNVQYVYKDENGKTRVSVSQLVAPNADQARRQAAKMAPAEEFVVSVHRESDDQSLGSVRHQAMILSGKVFKVPEYPEGEYPEGGDPGEGEEGKDS